LAWAFPAGRRTKRWSRRSPPSLWIARASQLSAGVRQTPYGLSRHRFGRPRLERRRVESVPSRVSVPVGSVRDAERLVTRQLPVNGERLEGVVKLTWPDGVERGEQGGTPSRVHHGAVVTPYGSCCRALPGRRTTPKVGNVVVDPLTDVACGRHPRSTRRLPNGALEQTRPAIPSTGAVLAAQRWCSADSLRTESPSVRLFSSETTSSRVRPVMG